LYPNDHVHYIGMEGNDMNEPIIVSIEKPSDNLTKTKCLIRTKKGFNRIWIENSQSLIRSLKNAIEEFKDVTFNRVRSEVFQQVSDELRTMEERDNGLYIHYKFGVLYFKEGQDENEMFSNLTKDSSPDWIEFINFLGDRVKLKNFGKYRGGLDVKGDTTGTESIHTLYSGYEIMFHVSTLLPYQENDPQRVERKRHLGNDVVIIIFKEGNQPFDPLLIHSQFNHLFFVIEKIPSEDKKTRYKMAVITKGGVKQHTPLMPNSPIFEKSEDFRNFLLAKCINSERIAMISPEFNSKFMRTRRELLTLLINNFDLKKKT